MKHILVVLSAFALAGAAVRVSADPQDRFGRFTHPFHLGGAYLGTSVEDLPAAGGTPASPVGARIRSVVTGSPADKAGLKSEDVVVRFDGEAVRSAAHLTRLVRETPPGRQVKVDISRNGAERTLTVTVGRRQSAFEEWGREIERGLEEAPEWLPDLDVFERRPGRLGIRYLEISGQLARYFHLERSHGILVSEVVEHGPAQKAGLKAGDILLAVDGREIENGHDLRRTIRSVEDSRKLVVKVLRDGRPLELTVVLGGGERAGGASA